ncbi:MAG: hypothetical protein Q9223_001371 [Gallowayella weberi]
MYILSQLSYLAAVASQLLLTTTAAPTLREDPKNSELDQRGLISPVPACSGVSTTNKRLFQLNGKTQYFAGTNAWWLGHLQKNEDVDTAVSQIAATGYKVARVWGFGTTNDPGKPYEVWYQVLNSSGQYFNNDPVTGIARLDYAVAAAAKKGIQLILPLLNNYNDLGGINTYTNAYGGSHNDFYTNPLAQTAYKNYIKFILGTLQRTPLPRLPGLHHHNLGLKHLRLHQIPRSIPPRLPRRRRLAHPDLRPHNKKLRTKLRLQRLRRRRFPTQPRDPDPRLRHPAPLPATLGLQLHLGQHLDRTTQRHRQTPQ